MRLIPANYYEVESLCQLIEAEQAKCISFTSAAGKTGSSSALVSVAERLKLADKRVLIVDLNLKSPALASWYGVNNQSRWSFADISCQLAIEDVAGIHFLSGEHLIDSFQSRNLNTVGEAFLRLAQEFDYVLCDTSPINAKNQKNVPAKVIMRWCDLNFLTVSCNQTEEGELAQALTVFDEQDKAKTHLILSQQQMPTLHELMMNKIHRMLASRFFVSRWLAGRLLIRWNKLVFKCPWLKTNP